MSEPSQLVVGDTSTHGGKIITGDPVCTINGKAAARINDLHSCPMFYDTDPLQTAPIPFTTVPRVTPFPHGVTPISIGVNSPSRMLLNGRPVALEGDFAGCGCVLKSNGPNLSTCLAVGALAVSVLALGAAFLLSKNRSGVPSNGNYISPTNNLTDLQNNMITNKVVSYGNFIKKYSQTPSQNSNTPVQQRPDSNENCNCK